MNILPPSLKNAILEKSIEKNNIEKAIDEWFVDVGYCVDLGSPIGNCICSHKIRYEFKIVNRYNGHKLSPIGSECIEKFGSNSMNVWADIAKLYNSDQFKEVNKGRIPYNKGVGYSDNMIKQLTLQIFSSPLMNKAIIDYLYENKYLDDQCHEFMLKIFNKRNKTEISDKWLMHSWINLSTAIKKYQNINNF
jgi:hypothetical protein